jgi:hypothetical protein
MIYMNEYSTDNRQKQLYIWAHILVKMVAIQKHLYHITWRWPVGWSKYVVIFNKQLNGYTF